MAFNERPHQSWSFWALLAMGMFSRLVPHPWNATPVMAIALFAGTHLSKRWGILLPLGIVAVTDVLIGWHVTVPFTWSAFALTGLLGWWVRARPNATRIVAAALTGSATFFLITNFGVWLVGGLYPPTTAGLWECFLAAVPFFRGTLLGDLIYTTVFFGSYHFLNQPRPAHDRIPRT